MAKVNGAALSILKYLGGKGLDAYMEEMLNIMEVAKGMDDKAFIVDVFGGGGHIVLSAMQVFDHGVYNDYDVWLCDCIRVLKDPDKRDKMYEILYDLDIDNELFQKARAEWEKASNNNNSESVYNEIERAALVYIVCNYSRYGGLKTLDMGIRDRKDSAYLENENDKIGYLQNYLDAIDVMNDDFTVPLQKYMYNEHAVIVLDPPYKIETRNNNCTYNIEIGDEGHEKMLQLCKQASAKIILCGYDNGLYKHELEDNGWNKVMIIETDVSKGNGRVNYKTEYVWINFEY